MCRVGGHKKKEKSNGMCSSISLILLTDTVTHLWNNNKIDYEFTIVFYHSALKLNT